MGKQNLSVSNNGMLGTQKATDWQQLEPAKAAERQQATGSIGAAQCILCFRGFTLPIAASRLLRIS